MEPPQSASPDEPSGQGWSHRSASLSAFPEMAAVAREFIALGRSPILDRWRAWVRAQHRDATQRGDASLLAQAEAVFSALDAAEAGLRSIQPKSEHARAFPPAR